MNLINEGGVNNNTLADIAAEIRRAVESMGDELPYVVSAGTMRRIADRIEAAWRREKAVIEADALAVGGLVEASRKGELSKARPNNAADFGQFGNAAAIREALEVFMQLANDGVIQPRTYGEAEHHCFCALQEQVAAALSAPARNCDKYSHDEALHVWAAEKEGPNNGCFDEWLYHNATEGGMK